MDTSASIPSLYNDDLDLSNEITWRNLYLSLGSFARSLIYKYNVPSWKGQEEDIIDDIVQETMRRLLEHSQKAERGEANPIRSLNHLMRIIAQNYYKDLQRHDRRLLRVPDQSYLPTMHADMDDQLQLLESVTEHVYQESLFKLLAHEIANFPEKQRRVLLIDLANRASFDTQPTPLQKAFLNEGIQLQQYREPIPTDLQQRSRYVSLLNHAYKRIAHLACVQEYISPTNADPTTSYLPMEQKNMGTKATKETSEAGIIYKGDLYETDQNLEMEGYIDKLPEPYQMPVRLHCIKKYTYLQIAKQLKLTKGTIKSQVSRGMKILRKLIEQKDMEKESNNKPKPHSKYPEIPTEIATHINSLQEPYRTAVRLHCIEKRTFPEIATQLNLPKGTVKSHVSRGMKMLFG